MLGLDTAVPQGEDFVEAAIRELAQHIQIRIAESFLALGVVHHPVEELLSLGVGVEHLKFGVHVDNDVFLGH